MALGKLLKGGSLVLAGVLIGGLLSYNSKKTEIVTGINDISNMAIVYKTQAKELTSQKETLVSEKTILEQEKAELEKQSNLDANKIKELTAKINELNNMIAFKDMLLQTTYEEAMRLEDEVENLTEQLEEAKKDSKNIVDEANKQIKQANQDQEDILNAVNQAKEKINNN